MSAKHLKHVDLSTNANTTNTRNNILRKLFKYINPEQIHNKLKISAYVLETT